MTTASIDLQGTPHPIVDTDPHPATSHLQDVRTYGAALLRYWADTALWFETQYANRYTIPVVASGLTILGAAIIGINL